MSKQVSVSGAGSPKRINRTYSLWNGNREVPQIKLSGRWLETIGFNKGCCFEVAVANGCIILNPLFS